MRQPTDEQLRWKAEAASLGLTLTDYVRAKVNETEVKVARVTDPALFAEVRRIGINNNQIAHGVNGGWFTGHSRWNAAIAAFDAVFTRMLKEYD